MKNDHLRKKHKFSTIQQIKKGFTNENKLKNVFNKVIDSVSTFKYNDPHNTKNRKSIRIKLKNVWKQN
tara:strand:- start:604 stop:807 length:204 start_codon:yes stop_codon:yes gene_type:complete